MSTPIDSLSTLVNLLTGGGAVAPERYFVGVDDRVAGTGASAHVIGRWSSLWKYQKRPGANGANPTTVAAPTSATLGALPFTNATGGRTKRLVAAPFASISQGRLALYDRLLHIGSLDATVTTAQTVGGALTRNTGGVGNEIWVEIYTIIGTTGTTITASYTNQSGVSGKVTPATSFGGTGLREAERIIPLPLADGDTGVQAVASVTVLASTTTAGNFGVTVARKVAEYNLAAANVYGQADFIAGLPGIPDLEANSCLTLAMMAATTTVPRLDGQICMVEI